MASALLEALAGDPIMAALFSEGAELETMLSFESALAGAEAELGLIPAEAARAIEAACRRFAPDMPALLAGMARDGVAGPAFVAGLRAAVGPEHGKWLHRGATSQDVVDTGLILRLKAATAELDGRLEGLIAALTALRTAEGRTALMAQTRMQRALPFTAADKIDTWLRPLERHRARLAALEPNLLVVQFGGPVGTRSGLDGEGDRLARALADRLALGAPPAWHSARDSIVEFGSWLALVAGTLGKIGADVALMAQNEIGAVRLARGGTSSAMAHKSNPVTAEVLVALARFAAGLAGTLGQAMISENERSGSAWTLEWLVLPQLVITAGAALRIGRQLVGDLQFLPKDGAGPG